MQGNVDLREEPIVRDRIDLIDQVFRHFDLLVLRLASSTAPALGENRSNITLAHSLDDSFGDGTAELSGGDDVSELTLDR